MILGGPGFFPTGNKEKQRSPDGTSRFQPEGAAESTCRRGPGKAAERCLDSELQTAAAVQALVTTEPDELDASQKPNASEESPHPPPLHLSQLPAHTSSLPSTLSHMGGHRALSLASGFSHRAGQREGSCLAPSIVRFPAVPHKAHPLPRGTLSLDSECVARGQEEAELQSNSGSLETTQGLSLQEERPTRNVGYREGPSQNINNKEKGDSLPPVQVFGVEDKNITQWSSKGDLDPAGFSLSGNLLFGDSSVNADGEECLNWIPADSCLNKEEVSSAESGLPKTLQALHRAAQANLEEADTSSSDDEGKLVIEL
ncbi:uncharacterized protein LOC121297936 [Polyodon spathula]|uniref:uncharacterized protein LOC121297936 n=1 Tax=Polyodon spathula TaxID=7913 RepID=UPI001B7DAE2E|nr:uncharacterized protein LOC121297936 [Polyodon spathula]